MIRLIQLAELAVAALLLAGALALLGGVAGVIYMAIGWIR